MSFISYAQNFEDVMLWRALKHIEHGFYIDIGANDPIIDSVSRAFYENGWRGVHIEPTKQYADLLKKDRPDEIVEQVAIGAPSEIATFYEFEGTGLSTVDPEIAKMHHATGYKMTETKVPIVSMDMLLDQYNDRQIHWLKLDVEGFEKKALESWETSIQRPWILVIESTKPLTQEQNYQEWESIIIQKGYSFAYSDGLNRFYVHHNHSNLLSTFCAPPNVFDGFELSGRSSHSFHYRITQLAQQAEARAQQAEAELQAVYASRSWRITKPLRRLEDLFRKKANQ